MPYKLQRKDGQIFEFDDADAVEQIVKSGEGTLLSPARVYNPQDKTEYDFDNHEGVAGAIAAGGTLSGSKAHQHQMKVADTGMLESGARAFGQGISMDFADEIQAAVRAPFGDGSLGDNYRKARDEYREDNKIAEEANPKTFMAGNIAGALGGALLPIPGTALKAGATLGQEVKLGLGLGAAAGLGGSEADLTKGEVGQTLVDAGKGALMGGTGGLLIGGGGRMLNQGGKMLAKGVGDFFGPDQMLLAMGARTKELNPKVKEQYLKAAKIMKDRGIFGKNADGSAINQGDIYDRLGVEAQEAIQEVGEKIRGVGHTVDTDSLTWKLAPDIQALLDRQPPGEKAKLLEKLQPDVGGDGIIDRINATGGDLEALWNYKKELGSPNYVGTNGWTQPANRTGGEVELYKLVNRHLADLLEVETSKAATALGGATGDALEQLNARYGSAIKLQEMLGKDMARNGWQATSMGLRFRDVVGGGMVGGMATALGAGPLAGVAGAVGGLVNAAARSTKGRLLRAEIGEKLHLQELEQGKLTGMLPRQLDGARAWLKQHAQMVSQAAPQLQPAIQKVLTAPTHLAEMEIRALMPMISQYMAPSQYKSEFNNKVSSPEDRIAVEQRYRTQGLRPHELAVRISKLNRDGSLSPEAFSPDEYMAELTDFANRLEERGE